jgi:uncharacterized protein
MRIMPQIVLAVATGLVGAACGASCNRQPPSPPSATIAGHTWKLEIARTEESRYQGLSDRVKLEEGTGMLFIYPRSQVLEFCMRNCYIPIDIAFVDANRRVVKVHTMKVEPRGLERETYSSVDPVQFALEVNAGELGKAGVKEGDSVDFSSVPDPAKAEAGP